MITRRTLNKSLMSVSALALASAPTALIAQDRPAIRIAVDNLWRTMAPLNGLSTTGNRININFYEALTEVDWFNDPSGATVIPKLALSWERDGNVWQFKLREGVMFHHGEEMTAEDVAFTLSHERLRADDAYEPRGAIFSSNIVRVEAVDRYTVEIETDSPDPNMAQKLSNHHAKVVPKAHYLEVGVDAFGQMPIGTGPYKVTLFRPGEVMTMDAFEDYWGDQPAAASLEWRIVPEYAGRIAGVVAGDYDFAVNVPFDQQEQVRGYDNINLINTVAPNYVMFAFNTRPDPEDNPLVDVRLRHAMIQSVDMETIVKVLFGDETFFPTIPFNFPDYGDFYDPDMVDPHPYDVEAARALIAETDYDGEELIWHITRGFYDNYETAAEIMIAQWAEVGINVKMVVVDNFSLAYQRPFHLLNMSNGTDFIPGDPYRPLWLDWNPGSTRASADWKVWDPTDKFVELGEKFVKAVEFEERRDAYLALSKEWQDVTPGMYMWKRLFSYVHRTGVDWAPAAGEMRMYGNYLTVS